MQIILNSIDELKDICSLIGGMKFIPEQGQTVPVKVETKEVVKAEKPKKDKVTPIEDKKEEPVKVEDKKEEIPKVEAEVTGVDTNSEEPPKDAEVKEPEVINITKEMVRAKFNAVVASGKQKEAKQLIENLNVKKLSDVRPEDYATLISAAEALL